MKMPRPDPTALVPALCFIGAVVASVFPPEHRAQWLTYLAAGAVLASPFLILLAAHFTPAMSWKRRIYLVLGSALLLYAWQLATFAMAWFKPGWFGAVALALVLSACAGLYVLPLRFTGKGRRGASAA